jgi:hypothetical protein
VEIKKLKDEIRVILFMIIFSLSLKYILIYRLSTAGNEFLKKREFFPEKIPFFVKPPC